MKWKWKKKLEQEEVEGAWGKKRSRRKLEGLEERKGAGRKEGSLRNRDKQLDLYKAFIDYLSLNYVKSKMKVDSESVENLIGSKTSLIPIFS